MVATSGAGWVLAPCLVGLIRETDRLYPDRATTADGSIGDQAHAARTSDHNPDGGYVRAVDITDDDYHGCDVSVLAHHLVAARDERVKYLIHRGTIWKSYASNGVPAWKPQVYTGANAHDHHLHVSILTGQERVSGPWWPAATPSQPPPQQEDDDMTPYIIEGEGYATRLVSPPFIIPIGATARKGLVAKGVPVYPLPKGEAVALVDQCGRALDDADVVAAIQAEG